MVLGIYGSGGLGREVLDLARTINASGDKWEEIVFINDCKNDSLVNGTKVLVYDECTPDNMRIVIAVGEPKKRQMMREKVTGDNYGLQTLIHPNAFVGDKTQIEDGVIIQYGCFVSCNIKIGMNVLLQPNSNIGHDSVIHNDAVISSFVSIAGACTVGERTFIGMNVPVKEKISIGKDSIIGMGSVVMRDIPENVIALGNPARSIKNNEDKQVFK